MNGRTRLKLASILVLVVLAVSACGGATPASNPESGSGSTSGGGLFNQYPTEAATEEAAAPSDLNSYPDAFAGTSGGAGGDDGVGYESRSEGELSSKDGAAGAPPVAAGDEGPAIDSAGSGSDALPPKPDSGFTPPDQQFQTALTAGEVDDNKDFAAYLQYRTDYMRFDGAPVHDLDISERHAIRVRTENGLPVLGAQVMVYDGQTLVTTLTTTATGVAYFFPNAVARRSQAQSYNVTVEKGQVSESFTLVRQNADDVWDVTLAVQPTQGRVKLDILFLLDATGSMGDEIAQIKDNILSISAQISALPSHPDVHFGLVTYRDRGDQYITRVADFTSDVQDFQSVLSNVRAAGGGDEPESLNEAMYQAISGQLHWRTDPDTVRLVFLVADAPPHLDYPQDYDYAEEMINAAAQGIKIQPIAASNTSNSAEYIFRQIAQFTGGRFIFLTYDETPQSSGEPGTELHVQEGSYTTEDLDALVVKLVQDELAQLSAAPGQQ